jgi:multiple sugar transport system permease protein
MRLSEAAKGFLFITPALVLLVVILGFPATAAILQSFSLFWVDRPSFTATEYTRLAFDPEFRNAFANTIGLVALVVTFHFVFGLVVALLLNLDIKAKWLFRVIALLPWTMPDVIAGLLWRFMFDTLPGVVNAVLMRVGALDQPFDFLGQPAYAFASLVLAEGWRGYPFVMLILLAGLQAIPGSQYEAAYLDGASRWQAFRYVTVPNLKTMLIIAIVLDTVWECRLFGMVFSLTGGGPGSATETLSLLTYRHYFVYFNVSHAAAISVVLATIMLLIAAPYLRITMRQRI